MKIHELKKKFEDFDFDFRHVPDHTLAKNREIELMEEILISIGSGLNTLSESKDLCNFFRQQKRHI